MKGIKIFVISIASIFVVTIGAIHAINAIYGEEMSQYVLQKCNEQLSFNIKATKVTISFLRTFPNISFTLKRPYISPSEDYPQDKLFSFENAYLQFDIIDFIRGTYKIEEIRADNGNITIINKDGKSNLQKLKSRNKQSGDFQLMLRDIHITNSILNYKNNSESFFVDARIKSFHLKGDFLQERTKLEGNGDVFIKKLQHRNITYLRSKSLEIYGDIKITPKAYYFNNTEVFIGDALLHGNGTYNLRAQKKIDFYFTGSNILIEELPSLLPPEFSRKIRAIEGNGTVSFSTLIKGHTKGVASPAIVIDFNIDAEQVYLHDDQLKPIKTLTIHGEYTNDGNQYAGKRAAVLSITRYNIRLPKSHLKGRAKVQNLLHPNIFITGSGKLFLQEGKNLVKTSINRSFVGTVSGDITCKINLKKETSSGNYKIKTLDPDGRLEFRNVAVQSKQPNTNDLTKANGTISIGEIVSFSDCSFRLNRTNYKVNGTLKNTVHDLLRDKPHLHINANVVVPRLTMKKEPNFGLFKTQKHPEKTTEGIYFPENIDLSLQVDVDSLYFDRFTARDVNAALTYKPKMITLHNLSLNSMNGNITGGGVITQTFENQFVCRSQLGLKRVDIKELFHSFHNFNQEVLQYKHINGSVAGDLAYSSIFSSNFKVIPESITFSGDLKLTDGKLTRFKPLYTLADYINIDKLRDVQFENLANTITIEDRKIIIPSMSVNSSAFHTRISGVHHFDGSYTYRIKMLLSDILAKKQKKTNNYGVVTEDGVGKTKIHLKVEGDTTAYDISYDRKAAMNDIKQKLRRESKTFKKSMQEEFTPLSKSDNKGDDNQEAKSGFRIGWENSEDEQAKKLKKQKKNDAQFQIEWKEK